MKITPAQRSMLQFMLDTESSKIKTMRPMRYHNLQTHNALVRKGLIEEDEPDEHGLVTTRITDTGRARMNAGE